MATVTSIRNPRIKQIRKAVLRGSLTAGGYCVAEGFHLLEEALRSGAEINSVFCTSAARDWLERRSPAVSSIPVTELPEALFSEMASTEASQGVLALVRPPSSTMDDVLRGRALVVVLDGVQDPGNAGAILRAAEAFGATGALFLKGSVNPYNPKALRASGGSIFRLPVLTGMDGDTLQAALEQRQVRAFALVPEGGAPIGASDLRQSCALILGSEGSGISGHVRIAATDVSIPTVSVESLNVALAAGIALYEARRQREPA